MNWSESMRNTRWERIGIALVALYFVGHLLYAHGLLWVALTWLGLALVTALLIFGAAVEVGRSE